MRVSITRGGCRGADLEIVRLRLSRRTHHRFARCDILTLGGLIPRTDIPMASQRLR